MSSSPVVTGVPYDLSIRYPNTQNLNPTPYIQFGEHSGYYRGEINTSKPLTPAKFIFLAGPDNYYNDQGIPGKTYIIQVQMAAPIAGAVVQGGNNLNAAYIGLGGNGKVAGDQYYLFLTSDITAANIFVFQDLDGSGTVFNLGTLYFNQMMYLLSQQNDVKVEPYTNDFLFPYFGVLLLWRVCTTWGWLTATICGRTTTSASWTV